MKKERWLVLLLFCFVVAAPGFARSKSGKLKVLTTFTVIQDMAQHIAGDAATIVSITKPGAEIHDYEPTPRDILKAQSADVVFWNGLHLERWFKRFFSQLHDVPAVVLSDGIKPLSIYEGPYQGFPNPHAWMSPKNALVYIDNIRKALVQYDPENAPTYNSNAETYKERFMALDKIIYRSLAQVPKAQRWLVTSEGAFSYLSRDYDMQEAYLWPINAEQQGTPKQIRHVIDLVRKHHIPVVFSESTISAKPAKQVAAETAARYGGILYVDSLSRADGPVPTYYELIRVTMQTIVNGFLLDIVNE